MRFDKIEKVHEGAFIDRYNVSYTTQDQRKKVYEIISRNKDLKTLEDLHNPHTDGVVIIMTDADVDGAHIATLLLTFLYRFMPDLIREGHVYLAQPPLYKVEKNKKVWYAYNDDELNAIMTEIGRDQNNKVQRLSLIHI